MFGILSAATGTTPFLEYFGLKENYLFFCRIADFAVFWKGLEGNLNFGAVFGGKFKICGVFWRDYSNWVKGWQEFWADGDFSCTLRNFTWADGDLSRADEGSAWALEVFPWADGILAWAYKYSAWALRLSSWADIVLAWADKVPPWALGDFTWADGDSAWALRLSSWADTVSAWTLWVFLGLIKFPLELLGLFLGRMDPNSGR
ncbi:hypothetical protein P4476_12125 [Ureibacillus terrenus]|uniref:hypothetical protein n=1 Tax=Ureibacillus terrenus TaxID=118246 RepID=UPI002E1E7547|nr:hypothetical protein [Ureibacillus terrenus]